MKFGGIFVCSAIVFSASVVFADTEPSSTLTTQSYVDSMYGVIDLAKENSVNKYAVGNRDQVAVTKAISGMTAAEKDSKYPTVAVAKIIADQAVTDVNGQVAKLEQDVEGVYDVLGDPLAMDGNYTLGFIPDDPEGPTIVDNILALDDELSKKQDKMTVSQSGEGNVVTAVTFDDDKTVTVTKGSIDLSGKQNVLTETQLAAVNSGITSDLVGTYTGYADTISANAAAAKAAQDDVDALAGVVGDENSGLVKNVADLGAQLAKDESDFENSLGGINTALGGKVDKAGQTAQAVAATDINGNVVFQTPTVYGEGNVVSGIGVDENGMLKLDRDVFALTSIEASDSSSGTVVKGLGTSGDKITVTTGSIESSDITNETIVNVDIAPNANIATSKIDFASLDQVGTGLAAAGDGVYGLTATITNGVVTLKWEKISR